MAEGDDRPGIYVLAGVNGAGKSSIFAEVFQAHGVHPFDPDAATALLLRANPQLGPDQANALAWQQGVALLERAIAERGSFAFETTLGGSTITGLLERAAKHGHEVFLSYVGLQGVDLHIARVRSRVARGGHDIPEERIRRRYDSSRLNLIRLLPRLTEMRLYDNTADADPGAGCRPLPLLVLHTTAGQVHSIADPTTIPEWAKPIVAAALSGRD